MSTPQRHAIDSATHANISWRAISSEYVDITWRGTVVERRFLRTFPVLRSTCSRWVTTNVGKPPATGLPTRPTQSFTFFTCTACSAGSIWNDLASVGPSVRLPVRLSHRATTLAVCCWAPCAWASAHRGKWGQLTASWKSGEKLKSENMQKRAVFWVEGGVKW